MATLGNTPRPGYVYDTETDTWVPIGVGAHTHAYIPNTLVDAKGDIVVASASDTPAILSKGSDGTVLVSDSTTSTGLAWQPYGAPFMAGKNKIINGDFAINQRGFSSSTAEGFGFDRWQNQVGGGTGTVTYSAQTFTPGTAPSSGYEGKNYIRCVTTGQSATGTYTLLVHKIESVRTLAGQTATLSFWAKAASGAPKIAIEYIQSFGSGGSPSGQVFVTPSQVTISAGWARYTVTTTIPSIGGKTIGTTTDGDLQVGIWLSSGSSYDSRNGSMGIQSNTFEIWGIQLEAGSIATPFTTATGTLQGELAACQRYYWRQTNPISNNYTVLGSAFGASTTTIKGQIKLPQTMRITPSSVEYSGVYAWDGVNLIGSFSGLALEYSNENYLNFTSLTAGGSFTQFRPYTILLSYPGQYIACSAEL